VSKKLNSRGPLIKANMKKRFAGMLRLSSGRLAISCKVFTKLHRYEREADASMLKARFVAIIVATADLMTFVPKVKGYMASSSGSGNWDGKILEL
jgi:hypothetical protein